MEKKREIELHQNEVKDIMEKPPHWLIGYGISLIGAILLFLLIGTYFFKYPDMIKSRIELHRKEKPERSIEGRILIPQSQLAKINIGQWVNIKFECYPYWEYGIYSSTITQIQCTQNLSDGNWHYEAIVSIDTTMLSSLGKPFHYWPGMSGEAEIITKDKRLLQQLLNHTKAIK